MRTFLWLLLAGALALGGDALDGEIKGGKAKKLVDEAYPLIKEGDALYRRYALKEIPETELLPALKKMVSLYEVAADKLQQALDIQEDPGVLGQQRILCRRIAKLRAQVFYRRPKKAPKPRPKPDPDAKPTPKPRPDKTPPDNKPAVRKPERDPDPEPEPPKVEFAVKAPPGTPVDAQLPDLGAGEGPEYDALKKREQGRIKTMLKAYYGARKSNKLHFRHRLCRGKGCADCGQTGRQINLYHFRKAFWNCYTPMLRDAPGARDALKGFHKHAHGNIDALGPTVKSFAIKSVDFFGYWARVTVNENTTKGKQDKTYALINAGAWYFFTPATDQELVVRGE